MAARSRITIQDNIEFAHAYVDKRRKQLGLTAWDWTKERKIAQPVLKEKKYKPRKCWCGCGERFIPKDETQVVIEGHITKSERFERESAMSEANVQVASAKGKPITQIYPDQLTDDREWAKSRGYSVYNANIDPRNTKNCWRVLKDMTTVLVDGYATEVEALSAARNLAVGADRNTYPKGTVYNKLCKCCNEPFETEHLNRDYKWGHKPKDKDKPKHVRPSSIPPTDPIKLLEFKRSEAVKEIEACDKEMTSITTQLDALNNKKEALYNQLHAAITRRDKIDTAVAALKDI